MTTNGPAGESARVTAPAPRAARLAYALSLLLLAVYAIDVIAGKVTTLAGARLEWRLGDLGEFLVVLAMAVTFVAGLMMSETA
jgi:hypothetical protein